MLRQSPEAYHNYSFSRRSLLAGSAIGIVASSANLALDVSSPLRRVSIATLPFVDKPPVHRKFNEFMQGTEPFSDKELVDLYSSVHAVPLKAGFSGWENSSQLKRAEVPVEGNKLIAMRIYGTKDDRVSMPVVYAVHDNQLMGISLPQSGLNYSVDVPLDFITTGGIDLTFPDEEFSRGVLRDPEQVQFFEVYSDNPLMQGLLRWFPRKIGTKMYSDPHPELLFREDMTIGFTTLDLRKNGKEVRAGLMKCNVKERNGDQKALWDSLGGIRGNHPSTLDIDIGLVGKFTLDGYRKEEGHETDTPSQTHDIFIQKRYIDPVPPGADDIDIDIQEWGDHGMVSRQVASNLMTACMLDDLIPDDETEALRRLKQLDRQRTRAVLSIRQIFLTGALHPNFGDGKAIVEAFESYYGKSEDITSEQLWDR